MSPATLRRCNSCELFPERPDANGRADASPADSGDHKIQGQNSAESMEVTDARIIKIDSHDGLAARSLTSRTRKETSRNQMAGMVSNGNIGRRLLNVREAAQYFDLEVDTIYRKSRLREVPSVKAGRALKFDVAALDRYIEQHTIEAID